MADNQKSRDIFNRALGVIPGGVSSPVRAFRAVGGDPVVIKRGEGAYLFDVDGNRYIDMCSSWGPLILGHGHPVVTESIETALHNGTTFGTPSESEVELAELICDRVEPVDSVRFVSSGTEAVMSAVRVARGFTGRDKIIKFDGCYHGHVDYLLVQAGSGLATFGNPSSAGVPEDFARHTVVCELDDEESVRTAFERHGSEIAAVLIEPIPANNGLLLQRTEFLQFLRKITSDNDSLLIFDEVISGFRIGMGGASAHYGIKPDIMSFGKVIGGGMPVGAFGGRRDVMDVLSPVGSVYQAGTLSANPIAMTAGLNTLRVLGQEDAYSKLEKSGSLFEKELGGALSGIDAQTVRIGSIVWVALQKDAPGRASSIEQSGIDRYNGAFRSVLDAGTYIPPSGYEVMFVSLAHTEEDLRRAAQAIGSALSR